MRKGVNLILVNSEGWVLCQHRDNIHTILGPDTWCAPGGTQEDGDVSAKTAAARELLEETGYAVDLNDMHLLAEEEYMTDKGYPSHRAVFWAAYDGKQKIECYEGREFRFISPKDLDNLKMYPGHEKFLRQASEEYFLIK